VIDKNNSKSDGINIGGKSCSNSKNKRPFDFTIRVRIELNKIVKKWALFINFADSKVY
jgi:hypothetical protein